VPECLHITVASGGIVGMRDVSLLQGERTVVLSKAFQLASLLVRSPMEWSDRVANKAEAVRERYGLRTAAYHNQSWAETVEALGASLGVDIQRYADEPALLSIEAHVREAIAALPTDAAFTLIHNADFVLAKACYLVCRAINPAIVVETGVAYGVTSAFMLKALEVNGRGTLHSIDLPPLGRDGDRFVGIVIPDDLRSQWRLHRGASKRILTALMPAVASVDLFIHDSLHTYRTIRRELAIVTPRLSPRAVVIADDVQDNAAFEDWIAASRPPFHATIREEHKESVFGIGAFGEGQGLAGHMARRSMSRSPADEEVIAR
jgi:hypothetical protein